jgi:hypothetical protein
MNPFRWKAEHGVALVVSMLVGAVTGPAVGYTFEIVARPPWARFALGGGSVKTLRMRSLRFGALVAWHGVCHTPSSQTR